MTKFIKDILANLILAENLIGGIKDAESAPPGHVSYARKRDLCRDAKRSLPAIDEAIELLRRLDYDQFSKYITDGEKARADNESPTD